MNKEVIISINDSSLTWFENPQGSGRGFTSPEIDPNNPDSLIIPKGWSGFIYPTDENGNIKGDPIRLESYRQSGEVVIIEIKQKNENEISERHHTISQGQDFSLNTIFNYTINLTHDIE